MVTGAADGYARMTGKPACTLLHLGVGLANGATAPRVVFHLSLIRFIGLAPLAFLFSASALSRLRTIGRRTHAYSRALDAHL